MKAVIREKIIPLPNNYRVLLKEEMIRYGDLYYDDGKELWLPCDSSIGYTVEDRLHSLFCVVRPVVNQVVIEDM